MIKLRCNYKLKLVSIFLTSLVIFTFVHIINTQNEHLEFDVTKTNSKCFRFLCKRGSSRVYESPSWSS